MPQSYRSTVITSCFIQFVSTLSLTFINAFITLFIFYDIGVGSLSQAAVWSGLSTFVAGSCLAIASPFWGYMTDRYGAKWMMVRVLITHSVTTALLSFAGSVEMVVVLRALRGFMGGTSIVAIAAIAQATPDEDMPKAMGYQHTAQLMGGIFGPIFGGLVAPLVGFRACFMISAVAIAFTIPLTLMLTWPEGQGKKAKKPSMGSLAGMERQFTAMFLVRASLNFLTPILPVYLRSTGIGEDQLTAYTGGIITIGNLALASSIPVMTRVTPRHRIPALMGVQSIVILAQGVVISLPSLLIFRISQMVVHSPVPPQLFSAATESRDDKGTAIGLMSSAKFFGGSLSPVISSTANLLVGLSFAFGCMSAISVAAALATWRLVRENGARSVDKELLLDVESD
ncbi:MAG: MFS transporter [Theionarchaea archaeon]|nr:MFS transporter [Theionarchaea archaeon]